MARGKNFRRGAAAKNKKQNAEAEVVVADVKQVTAAKENGLKSSDAGSSAVKKGKKRLRFRKKPGTTSKTASAPVEDFAGLIFMCNTETKKDCFKHHVFGLPEAKRTTVENAKKGSKLFLFDIDQRVLYGVYRASSLGGMNLVSEAFQDSERKFPAQIRFRIHKDCAPLDEHEFKPAIQDNYFGRNKFRCELSSEQVGKLVRLFRPLDSSGLPKPKAGKDFKAVTTQKGRTASNRSAKTWQSPPGRYPGREPVSTYAVGHSYPSAYSAYAPTLDASRLDTEVLYRPRLDALERRSYVDPMLDASLRLAGDLSRRRLTEDLYTAERSLPPRKGALLYDDLYRDLPYQRDALYRSDSGRASLGTLPYKPLSTLPWALP